MHLQEQTVNVNGQIINYVKTGEGNKTLLCFPGALGTIWSDFKPQIADLDKTKFTVIAWDPPGYGSSRPPERNFSVKFYENDADTAYNFMMQLGIKKFSLLGWSDGGISSMIISAKYPTVVDKLIIWGANAYVIPEEIQSYEKIRDISQWSDRMKAPLIKLYTEEGLQTMWNNWCDALNQIFIKSGGDLCKESLKNITCPTLILHGDKDPMVADEHPEYLASNIKGAKLYRFPEGKHNIHLRFSREFNDVVTEFLLK
ncbi:valacyclovir hydrolase [Asbolus verrucosus]|uniref:Valacyclovir hydrolase n=1 Tax=Asbolus verrucosus TaxID=1661398 RepID=A0A482VHH6_ASBVE|nr:valacyclovir hydrolase [Asbolus verrucosus]